MKNITEKEYYKGRIAGMIDNIDNIDILCYIYIVVNDIMEEQKIENTMELPIED